MEEVEARNFQNLMYNLNRMRLNNKEHIKKYSNIRKTYNEIVQSMLQYIYNGNYNIIDNYKTIYNDVKDEIKGIKVDLRFENENDITILSDLFMYKNHPKLTSIIEIYLKKNKLKNKDKVKILNCMNNSYIGLFKIVGVDPLNGYVTYEDVLTKKKYKIIDVSMSSTLIIDKNNSLYMYNRIITVDDISFGTGLHCAMTSKNELLQKFIKSNNYKKVSNFSRSIILYDISKKEEGLTLVQNHNY